MPTTQASRTGGGADYASEHTLHSGTRTRAEFDSAVPTTQASRRRRRRSASGNAFAATRGRWAGAPDFQAEGGPSTLGAGRPACRRVWDRLCGWRGARGAPLVAPMVGGFGPPAGGAGCPAGIALTPPRANTRAGRRRTAAGAAAGELAEVQAVGHQLGAR